AGSKSTRVEESDSAAHMEIPDRARGARKRTGQRPSRCHEMDQSRAPCRAGRATASGISTTDPVTARTLAAAERQSETSTRALPVRAWTSSAASKETRQVAGNNAKPVLRRAVARSDRR